MPTWTGEEKGAPEASPRFIHSFYERSRGHVPGTAGSRDEPTNERQIPAPAGPALSRESDTASEQNGSQHAGGSGRAWWGGAQGRGDLQGLRGAPVQPARAEVLRREESGLMVEA